MDDLLDQMQKGLEAKLYYLSLFAALSIPDICGALSSEDGKATRDKYIKWFDANLKEKYGDTFNGEICYYFRCSLLHQGSSQHFKIPYERIFFMEPECGWSFHNCTFSMSDGSANKMLSLNIITFCNDMNQACSKWKQNELDSEFFKKNYGNFMRRYPEGISPYIINKPIIG